MLVLSFLLHVLGAWIFQIAYPRSHTRLPRHGEVFYLRPGSPEAARLTPLIEADDPALFSPGQVFGRDVWRVPDTTYEASFDAEHPTLEQLPPAAKEAFLPAVSSFSPVEADKKEPAPAAAITTGPATVVKLTGLLKDRTLAPPEAGTRFPALSRQGLLPAEFLIAVSPEGLPLHAFLLQSSGNETLDRAALRHLAGSRFSRMEGQEAAWGTATFLWGADVERQKEP